MNSKNKSIGINAIWNGILSLASILFPIITFPYITRVLGVEVNGAISFAMSVTNYFSLFATLGLSTYGVKACARVKDNRQELSKVTHELLIISMISAFLTLSVFYLSIVFIPQFRQYRFLMLIYSINIILNVLGMNWMYQGIEKFKYITTRSLIFKVISIILMFLFVKNSEDGAVYAAISVFATGAGNILNIIYSHNYIDYYKYTNYEIRKHIKPILILFATTLAVNVYSSLDTVMLGLLQGDYATGIYSVAVKIKTILITLISSFSVVMMSRMSYVSKDGEKNIYSLLKKSYELLAFVTLPLCVFFVILSRESVCFISGDEYAMASTPMIILMPTIVISSLSQIIGSQYSVSIGKEKNLMIAVISGAIANVIFNAILIPIYSYDGAAIGTIIAESTQFIIQILLAQEMVSKVFSVKQFLKAFMGALVAALVTLCFNNGIYISGLFFKLLFSAVVYFLVYLGIMHFMHYELVDDFEKMILEKIKRR